VALKRTGDPLEVSDLTDGYAAIPSLVKKLGQFSFLGHSVHPNTAHASRLKFEPVKNVVTRSHRSNINLLTGSQRWARINNLVS
jgi:hypothetical protein